MGRQIDEDDIIDAGDAAAIVGLASRNGVHEYLNRKRKGDPHYQDVPDPFKRFGKCLVFRRREWESYASSRKRSSSLGSGV